ncbi:MAG: hypothetical protein ACOYMN_25380, partial [Roseimicrobium sp.]
TAGVQVADPTLGGTFDTPQPNMAGSNVGNLGVNQQSPPSPVQYTMAGGNVSINAGNDLIHLTRNTANVLIPDSSRQLPTNWLYRRGAVDPITGLFAESRYGFNNPVSDVASTTWWVDFTNFFEGIGALGGGDVSLIAGRDISNVDGAVPTNARMPGKDALGNAIAPNANGLIELGGGDLTVRAGRNIDGGAYYVERGQGTLFAGSEIKTNNTRSPSRGIVAGFNTPDYRSAEAWLPTTLFAGSSSFDVTARGNVLMGPVANPSILPQGYNNTYWYKTYFTTYSTDSAISIASLGGDVTLRKSVITSTSGQQSSTPALNAWFDRQLVLTTTNASNAQPWLRLAEPDVALFKTVSDLMPSSLDVTAFSGGINSVGNLTLSPSASGGLQLIAATSISGFQPSGVTTINGVSTKGWTATTINVSDSDPTGLPGIASPIAYQNQLTTPNNALARFTQGTFLLAVDNRLTETGSYTGSDAVLQTKEALHAAGLLHAADTEPVRIYAQGGDISGFTLFSPKTTKVFASNDIGDIAFYIQNLDEEGISIVAAGRDIIPYNPNTASRVSSSAR